MIEIKTRKSFLNTEFRAEKVNGKLYLDGYFIRFNEETELWDGVFETVLPESIEKTISNDIRCLFNHDMGSVLGRTSNGTLQLKVDEQGVFGTVEINQEDSEAMSIYAKVKRGDISACSFGFNILDETIDEQDGVTRIKIKEMDLIEVSIVAFPAYPTTEISARSKDIETEKRRKLEIERKRVKEKINGLKTINLK